MDAKQAPEAETVAGEKRESQPFAAGGDRPGSAGRGNAKGGELHVCLSTGRKIEVCGGFDPQVLRQLVRVLEQA